MVSQKERDLLANPSLETFPDALAVLHRADLHRRRVAEEGQAVLDDPRSDLDQGEREELSKLVQSAASLRGRRTFFALSLGWRRAIINLHIPLHDTQGANHALGEFFRMPPSGSDMIVWHNGFDDQERACLEQLERGYSRMLENTKRRRESGKIKKMHERSNVDPALLGKMTGDYADTVLGFARAFDAFVERINRTPSPAPAPSPPPPAPPKPPPRQRSSSPTAGRSSQNPRPSPAPRPASQPLAPAQQQPLSLPSPIPAPPAHLLPVEPRRPSPLPSPAARRVPSPGVRAGSHILVEDSDEGEEEKDLLKEWIEIEEEQEEVREEKMEVREVEMELLERGVDSQQDEVMSQQEEGEMGLEEEDVEVETDLVVTRVVVDSPARPTTEEEDYMYGDEPEPQIPNATLAPPPPTNLNPPQSPRRSPRLSPSPSPEPPRRPLRSPTPSRARSPLIPRSPRPLSAANSLDSIASGPLLISRSHPDEAQPSSLLLSRLQQPAEESTPSQPEQTQPPAARIPLDLRARLLHAAEENTAKLEKEKAAIRAKAEKVVLHSFEIKKPDETDESTQEPATEQEQSSSIERTGQEGERSQDPSSIEWTEEGSSKGKERATTLGQEVVGKMLAPTPSGIQMPPPPPPPRPNGSNLDPLPAQPKTSTILVPGTPPTGVDAPTSSNSNPTSSNPATVSDSQSHSQPGTSDSQAGNRSTDDSASSLEAPPAAQPHSATSTTIATPIDSFRPILDQSFPSVVDTTIDEMDPPKPGQVAAEPTFSSLGQEPTTPEDEPQTQAIVQDDVLQTQASVQEEDSDELEYLSTQEAERRRSAARTATTGVPETQEAVGDVGGDEEMGRVQEEGEESFESVVGLEGVERESRRIREASSPRSFCDLDEEATGALDDGDVIAGIVESTRAEDV